MNSFIRAIQKETQGEGWVLVDTTPNGYSIQNDDSGTFEDSYEATRFVIQKALEGSRLHRQALFVLASFSHTRECHRTLLTVCRPNLDGAVQDAIHSIGLDKTQRLAKINEATEGEGWAIFLSDEYGYRIERIDEEAIFEGDMAANVHVVREAFNGSLAHADAMTFVLRYGNKEEPKAILMAIVAMNALTMVAWIFETK